MKKAKFVSIIFLFLILFPICAFASHFIGSLSPFLYVKTISSSPVSLSVSEACNSIILADTGASILNLPQMGSVQDGCHLIVRLISNVSLYVDPYSTQSIDLEGVTLTAGRKIAAPPIPGVSIELIWDSAHSKWITLNMTSLWTDGGE